MERLIPIAVVLLVIVTGCTSVRTVDFDADGTMSHEIRTRNGSLSYGVNLVRRADSTFWTDSTGRKRALARPHVRSARPISRHTSGRPWTDVLDEINTRARTKHARLELIGGTVYPAEQLRITRDTTQWLDEESGEFYQIPTTSIGSVQFNDASRGAWRGIGVASTIGAMAGIFLGLADGGGAALAAIGAGLLGVVAAPVGAVIGSASKLRYQFVGAPNRDDAEALQDLATGAAPLPVPVQMPSDGDPEPYSMPPNRGAVSDWKHPGEQASRRSYSRWTVSALGAGAVGKSARRMEDAMNATGFGSNYRCGGFCGGDLEYPSSSGWLGWLIDVRRQIRSSTQVGFLISRTGGETNGYDGNNFLGIRRTVTSYAAIFSLRVLPVLRMGLGPALHRVGTAKSSGLNASFRHQFRMGVVADLALTFPAHTRFFLDLRGQYRVVGSAVVGPFNAGGSDQESVFPASSVGLNHGFIGAGFGVRL